MVESAVEGPNGNLGLIIDADPGGRSGFVRSGSGTTPKPNGGPLHNMSLFKQLGGRWSYQVED